MAEAIVKLIKKRSLQKGQCARINTRMQGESQITAEIDPHSIDRHREAATRAETSLREIHEALVDADPSKEDEYDKDLEKAVDSFEKLQAKLLKRSNLGHACVKLERISEATRNFIITEEGHSSALHHKLDKITADFEKTIDLHRAVIRTDEHLAGMKSGISMELAKLSGDMPPIEIAADSVLRRHGGSPSVRASAPYHRRLPVLETPKFNGDFLTWNAFWTTFKRNVHENTDLTDDERLSYLQQSIKDGAQHNLVDELAGTYQDCLTSLKARYQKPKKIHQHYAQTFVACPVCKDDSRRELTRVHTTLSHAWKQLLSTKKVAGEQLFEAIAEKVLPPTLQRKWAEQHPDPNKVPALEELLEFIEFQAGLSPEEGPQEVVQKKERDRKVGHPKVEQPQKPERGLFAVKHHHPCMMCHSSDHSLYGCAQFQELTVDARAAFVDSNGLCYNCLGKGHDKRTCRSTYTCRTCSKKHHSLLHRDTPATAPLRDSTSAERVQAVAHQPVHTIKQDSPTVETIAPTMGLTVSSPRGHTTNITALFDGGATISVVTNKVVARLGLKKRRCCMKIVQALGDSTSSNTKTVQLTVTSAQRPGETRQLTAVVVPTIGQPGTGRRLVPQWNALEELPLADPKFMVDKTIDLIIGQNISASVYLDRRRRNSDTTLSAQETIWGWTVEGRVGRPQRLPTKETTATRTLDKSTIAAITIDRVQDDASTNKLLQQFFEGEEQVEDVTQSHEDQQVLEHFKVTHRILPDGRFQVSLPRKEDGMSLGTSRGRALQRYLHNEGSLTRRKALQPFQTVMREYFDLNHAEVIPSAEISAAEHYYMPMHAVMKATSTTTKLRVVFDASASTSSGASLNDLLMTGPTVYPALTTILIRFRAHKIGITSDISKMYREVALHPQDRDLHRFLWRESPNDIIQDCRMRRVTFGVASSPFMATQVLQEIATNCQNSHPAASSALQRDFYVDDCISGADSPDQALEIQQQLCQVLEGHKMTLRKWRSSSEEVLTEIPGHLLEGETSSEPYGQRCYQKTLGVQWNAQEDVFHVSISDLQLPTRITKRALTSDVAKTFDVLGWFSPTIFVMKAIIQELWASKTGWDEPVPKTIQENWTQWRNELPSLSRQPISRRYFGYTQGERTATALHGFSDASLKGYAAVVYIRATYEHGPPSVMLVQAKTKVAPLKGLTIPRLELCGAQLLARLITQVMTTLDIKGDQVWCWTDSAIVLHWLDGKTRPHRTYVANRVRQTLADVPPRAWRHVPGTDNPADCASRGINPRALQAHGLWWHGPAWLSQDPINEPTQPHLKHLEGSSEELIQSKSLSAMTTAEDTIENRYSTFKGLRRTVAWMLRFTRNTKLEKQERPLLSHLSVSDIQAAETILYRNAQRRMVARTGFKKWAQERVVKSLNPTADVHGIYRVNGRLENSALGFAQRNPIILDGKDRLTHLLITHHHVATEHSGPTLLMSTLSRNHHVIRGLVTVKAIVRKCVVCTRTRMATETQLMGQLPKARVNPSRPFSNVGTDFAGPITLKLGHTRRPVHVKGYVCLFVCMTTKATHLEVVSSLTTEAFLSCLTRFVSRRGLPTCIFSDNGSNYVGASRELEEVYQVMRREDTQQALAHYCVERHVEWSFSPARAPHFGGLWEAAVRSFKTHFRKISKSTVFNYEEMTTILCRIEMALNSRPLMPLYVHSSEGVDVLTPGHFLIGQPLHALPERRIDPDGHPRSRFKLCQQLIQEFWQRWSQEYLHQLNARTKWQKEQRNVQIGDIALIRGETTYRVNEWPMARVTQVYAGADGMVRAVELQNGDRTYRRPITKLTILVQSQPDTEDLGPDILGMAAPPAGMSESDDSEQEA